MPRALLRLAFRDNQAGAIPTMPFVRPQALHCFPILLSSDRPSTTPLPDRSAAKHTNGPPSPQLPRRAFVVLSCDDTRGLV